jgi:signal transduction histidine kinase
MLTSLRSRFLLANVGIATIPLIAIFIILNIQSVSFFERQSIALNQEISYRFQEEIERFILELETNILILDDFYHFVLLDTEELRDIFLQLLQREQQYQEISLIAIDGQELLHLSRTQVYLKDDLGNYSTDSLFLQTVQTGETAFGLVTFDETIREPILPMAIPLHDLRTGLIAKILIVKLRFKPIWDLLAIRQYENDEIVYVVDTENRVIAHHNQTVVLSNTYVEIEEGEVYREGLSGERVLYTNVPIYLGDQEFKVVVERDVENVREFVNQFSRNITLIFFIGVIASGIISYLISQQIVNPIEELGRVADAYTHRDFSQRVIVNSGDELEVMANAFNQMGEELDGLLTGLEIQVDLRTKELQRAKDSLEEFAYVVSHDLKAPLRGIGQLAYWLKEDYAEKLGEEGIVLIDKLLERTHRLENLISDILTYSRIGRIQNPPELIVLKDMLLEIIDSFGELPDIRIEILTALPELYSDKILLIQIFQNLLSNAVKYMDKEQGEIYIGCEEKSNRWEFYVKDNGPGIEAKYHDKIFQIFQTLGPRDSDGSTGVGLAMVRRAVESLGGEIWVESAIGKGTIFLFDMPKK